MSWVMRRRIFYILGIATTGVLASCIFFSVAHAFGEIYPSISIEANVDKRLISDEYHQKKCLDQKCLFFIEKDAFDNQSIERSDVAPTGQNNLGQVVASFGKMEPFFIDIDPEILLQTEYPLDKQAFFEALDTLITDDISDLKPVLFSEAAALQAKLVDGSTSGNAYFSKKGSTRIDEFTIFGCEYYDYKSFGNWIRSRYDTRAYCYSSTDKQVRPSFSFSRFLLYIPLHFNDLLATSLIWFLIVALLVVGFFVYLIRRNELRSFARPTFWKIAITLVIVILWRLVVPLGWTFWLATHMYL